MAVSNFSLFVFYLVLTAATLVLSASKVKIQNNGYSDIVVAFDNNIKPAEGEPLIQQIKTLFTVGSKALYTATRKRSYFNQVTIVIPKSWPKKSEYQIASFETYAEADVRITKPNPMHGDGPYTQQPRPCGNPGDYIHLTPNYLRQLTANSTYLFGDPGKTLVHEWAHLRYGIFNEYPDPLKPTFPKVYYDASFKKYLPNACTNQDLVGDYWNPREQRDCAFDFDGKPEADCVFIVDPNQNQGPTSSMGSYHFLPNVHTFCDDTEDFLHNIYAPNMHNKMCSHRSTWNVITSHEDFKNQNNPAEIANLIPTFKLVQQEEATFCFVLDASGSMDSPSGYTKLSMLRDAATRWIKEEVAIGSAVGIVEFSSQSAITHPVVRVTSDTIKNQLISKLPPRTTGSTCIGCGLRHAIQELRRFRGTTGGVIVLISDGEEDQSPPQVKDVLAEVVNANIRVVSIIFTAAASGEMEKLADATGGKTYFVPLQASVHMLDTAFHAVSTYQTTEEEDFSTKIKEERFQKSSGAFQGHFKIDKTIGRDTAVNFLYLDKSDITDIVVSGPNVASVSMTAASNNDVKIELNDNQKQIRFVFKQLEPGTYNYVVSRRGSTSQDVTVTVMSKAKIKGDEAITTACTVTQVKNTNPPQFLILAEVKKGTKPVVNAQVIAKVDRPDLTSVNVELFDEGSRGDITANDGIYSGYFTNYIGKGRYSVQANVISKSETTFLETGFAASGSLPVYNRDMVLPSVTNVPTGDFERVAAAGSIQLTQDLNTEKTDIFPPSRVNDLRVITISQDNSQVELQWSAPGDDLENGQAKEYDLRYTMDLNGLKKSFRGQRYDATPSPKRSGEIESLTAQFVGLGNDVVYYIALRTKDKAGLWSEMSNIVEIRGN